MTLLTSAANAIARVEMRFRYLAMVDPTIDNATRRAARQRFGRAWFALAIGLALHVADEALTDFLSVYNPIVRAARERFGWFPMPEFTFVVWLAGLCVLVMVLLLLTALAYRGARGLRLVAYPFAVLMFLNGVGHLVGSVLLERWAPGATTAPLLLVTSSWLFVATLSLSRATHAEPTAGRNR